MKKTPKIKAPKKARATVHVSVELFDQVRDAVVALSGPPWRMTLSDFATSAFERELERLRQERNEGKPFPKRTEQLRAGRPIR